VYPRNPVYECWLQLHVYPAVERNYHKCVFHVQSWFPKKHVGADGKVSYDRGHLLLGPEFYLAKNPRATACSCDMALCKGIGYMNSMSTFPTDSSTLDKYLRNTGVMLTSEKKQKSRENPTRHKLVYWHFDVAHRYFDSKPPKKLVSDKVSFIY
jgi:hypothetical protein